MACCLSGAKPISQPILVYCYWKTREQHPVKFEWKYKDYQKRKWISKYCLQNGSLFVLASMCTQQCGCWFPGAKASGHQYPQCWLCILCTGPITYELLLLKWITSENKITFWKQIPRCLRVRNWLEYIELCYLDWLKYVQYDIWYANAQLVWNSYGNWISHTI